MPSHESEALEDKQKLQMKTFRELAECLARISLLLMFSSDLLFAIKRDAYILFVYISVSPNCSELAFVLGLNVKFGPTFCRFSSAIAHLSSF